ncbi:MAG: SMC-Scp complex subunit ScpB [Candidatus Acidiferrales bacterium]
MERNELKALLEAIIYVSEEPVTLDALAKALREVPREELRGVLKEMVEATHAADRGVEIRVVAGGYRMYTKAEHHEAVRRFVRSQKPPLRLSMPALETLAVIAYKQPVTGPEVEAIRGVDPSSALATLLDKGLVVTAGRKQCVGRPILYRTSKEFLIRFGLSGVDELPTLKEFEELARAALGEVEMPLPAPEEPAAEPPAEPVAEENPAVPKPREEHA